MIDNYVNLHVHSTGSILDGLIDPGDLARKTKEWGMPAVAITDHGTLSSVPQFYKACKKEGIKPIIGIEAYTVPDLEVHELFRSPSGKQVRTGYHLILLAKNLKGYKNLIALNNIAQTKGFYYAPKMDWKALMAHKEGLIVSSACVGSEIGQMALGEGDPRPIAAKFKEAFGDDYYLEVMENGMAADVQRTVNKRLIGISKSLDIKIIPTNDSHYLEPEQQKMHDVAMCMHTKKVLSDPMRMKYDGLYHLKSVKEMKEIFPEYMLNTLEVAEKIDNYEIFDRTMKLPVVVQDPDKMLDMMTHAGLISRGLVTQEYLDRLEFELGVIKKMGFSAYMLTVKEVVDLIISHGCPIGWGRGSAGGSLICYALNITDVDPIKYGLLFERFMSEFRPDWPDIDIDISRAKRDSIIDALIAKYGVDKVAHISTYSYLKPKSLIRDVCRAAEKPLSYAEALCKMVPKEIAGADEIEKLDGSEIEKQLSKSVDGKAIWSYLNGLLGIPRHAGVHASGIVISSEPLTDHLPMRHEKDTNIIQFDMNEIDDFGFLKFDLLGLETLDLVFETAKELGIDVKKIPLDDEKTYALFAEGRVSGVFQMDKSRICSEICKRMHPRNIRDLADIIALNRPGVLDAGLLEVYLRRREGLEQAVYIHPDLKKILEPSYGVCIYQEDLMRMAALYAGYTPLEVENLRKGIGKKDQSIIKAHIPIFREKALALGRDPKEVEVVLEQVEAAGNYSFNLSHAVQYAMLSYTCEYLAANHPLHFFKNVINHSADDDRAGYLSEVMMRKIGVLRPDINTSQMDFSVEHITDSDGKPRDVIRWGMLFVKGIGDVGVKKIMANRPYKCLKDVTGKLGPGMVALLHGIHALDGLPDVGNYRGIGKIDEAAVLGIPLSGMLSEYQDVVDFIGGGPVAEMGDTGYAVIKMTDVIKRPDKRSNMMAFCEGFDVFGPQVKPMLMFASVFDNYGKELKKGGVYACVLARLGNGGYQITGLNSVENIRLKIAAKSVP